MNGYKIAEPTVLAHIPRHELESLLIGYGHKPYFVEGSDPKTMHRQMSETIETVIAEIRSLQREARENGSATRPQWPMIVLRTPKGWTGPKEVDGKKTEDSWRSHQVPLSELAENPEHLAALEQWLKSYRPEELFDEHGRLMPELKEIAPKGLRRMGSNPHANGGLLLRDLRMPDFRDYAVDVQTPGHVIAEATRTLGGFLRDITRLNAEARNFRAFAADEHESNRLGAMFEVTNRAWLAE